MMSRAVILNMRVAVASDFSTDTGQKKYGCLYFQQNINGTFCNQPYYFHENTDMEVFRALYRTKQIWVLAGIFDDVDITYQHNHKTKSKSRKPGKRPCTCRKK